MVQIRIPSVSLESTISNIERLLQSLLPSYQEEQITLDFTECRFIAANGITILAGMKLVRDTKGFQTQIDMTTISESVKKVLMKWRFLDLFGQHVSTIKRDF